jgi:probable HAF family extracellular repeat protein
MDLRPGTGKLFVTVGVLCVSLLIAGRVDAMPLYTLTNFGSAIPQGIDDAGDVVLNAGNYTGPNPYNGVYHSYGPSAGQITPLSAYGLTNPSNSMVAGIVNSGTVFGEISVGNSSHAFISSGGQVTDLGTLPGYSDSQANAANASGVVVGGSFTPTGSGALGFVYANSQMSSIGTLGGSYSFANAVNNSGQITGSSTTFSGTTAAFLYQNGTMINLGTLGGNQSIGYAINAQGQVAGSSILAGSTPSNFVEHAFLYSNGKMLDLGTLPGSPQSEALGINNSSQVVGDSAGRAFVWQNGTMYDLSTLLKTPSPFALTYATAINNLGQIIGFSDNGGALTGFLLTPDNLPPAAYIPPEVSSVPEPSTFVIFGVIALACILRNRSRRSIAS